MNGDFKLIGTGYLYALWHGKIIEYHGEIQRKETSLVNRISGEPYTYISSTYFMVKDSHDRTTKKLQCSNFEGVVFNKSVWLFKSDRNRAINELLSYEKKCIENLRDRISNHEALIEQLETALSGEEQNGAKTV